MGRKKAEKQPKTYAMPLQNREFTHFSGERDLNDKQKALQLNITG